MESTIANKHLLVFPLTRPLCIKHARWVATIWTYSSTVGVAEEKLGTLRPSLIDLVREGQEFGGTAIILLLFRWEVESGSQA